jgi:hypothetical protein
MIIDSTGTAAVDHTYFWQPMDTCPRGVKVQLLNAGGVAVYGQYQTDSFWKGWAPLPKNLKTCERAGRSVAMFVL